MSENLTQLDRFCLFVFSSSVENEFGFQLQGAAFFHVLINVVLRGPTSSFFKSKSSQISVQSPEVFGGFSLLEFKSKSCGPHPVTAGITCIRDAVCC